MGFNSGFKGLMGDKELYVEQLDVQLVNFLFSIISILQPTSRRSSRPFWCEYFWYSRKV